MVTRRSAKRQRTSGDSLDMTNYLNWSAVVLREKLLEANISASSNFPISVLRKLYVDNVLGKDIDASNSQNESRAINVNSAENSNHTNGFSGQSLNLQSSSAVSVASTTSFQSTTYPSATTSGGNQISSTSSSPAVIESLVHTVQSLQTMVSSLTTLITTKDTHANSSPSFNLQQFYRTANENTQSTRKFGTNPEELPQMELISNSIRKNIIDDKQVQKPSSSSRQTPSSLPTPAGRPLETSHRIEALMEDSISVSTRAMYNSGYQAFLKFSRMNNTCQSVSESTLMEFVTYCYDSMNLSYQTIKLYLCGIRHHLTLLGIPNPFTDLAGNLPRLHMLLSGIKRQSQSYHPSRQPITYNVLQDMCSVLQKGVNSKYTDTLMTTVCVVAFFGFLRCAEFTCKAAFNPHVNLCVSDVQFYNDHVVLFLKQSKTYPFRKGLGIKLFKNNSVLCPFEQLKNYLSTRNALFDPKMHLPLFIMENGSALSRCNFLTMLRDLLKRSNHGDSYITGLSF
ncbi:uncharacterized protein LOC133192043 [Saccostrea echinata]|uniref:uncharacterized protein LOC133192043 n=1 Tax=Saccostrea echinata TaxID=191078 RepID=UPI002A81C847|nr:uncharacterized protein LOC133192043 [Saccostrea echinata]